MLEHERNEASRGLVLHSPAMAEPDAPGVQPPAPAQAPPPGQGRPQQATSAEPTLVQRLRAAPITAAIIAMNVALFAWMQQSGGADDTGTLLRFGALEPLHVWAGEYWRLFTCMFMHGSWLHVGVNMYMAAGWATALERALGKKRFVLVYLVSGLTGSCASMVWSSLFQPHMSVGASGALFGVMGAVLALRHRQLGSFAAFFADRSIRSLLMQVGILTAVGVYLHFDNAAHFGGLAAGFLITWLIVTRASRSRWLALGAALGALFIVAVRPWWTPQGADANDFIVMGRSYLTGQEANGARWPLNVARGERFLEKGCKHGLAHACDALADHLTQTAGPDAAARAEALRRRGCEIDPGHCRQIQ